MNEMDDRRREMDGFIYARLEGERAGARSVQNTSFIRLHAKYRERGDVLTRDNHEIMRAISVAFRFILAFYSSKLNVARNIFIDGIYSRAVSKYDACMVLYRQTSMLTLALRNGAN